MKISFWRLPFSILQEKKDGMNLKTDQYKISKLKNRAGKIFLKRNRDSRTNGTISKELLFIL